MRFLVKPQTTRAEGVAYKDKGHNEKLRQVLIDEQQWFCAYTERRFRSDDTIAIEHFDKRLKGTPQDDHNNWYAVLQKANQLKRRKEKKHEGATFFETRFFQHKEQLEARIGYEPVDGIYFERNENDAEARDLLDFLSVNERPRVVDRLRHINRLKCLFEDMGYSHAEMLTYFSKHPEELDFVTALEKELHLDLSEVLHSKANPQTTG